MSEDNGVKALRPSTFKITSKKNPTRSRSKTCGDTGVDTANTGSSSSDFKTTELKVEGFSSKADGDQLKRNRSESRTRPPGNVDTPNSRGRSQAESGFDGTRAEKFTHRRAKSSLEGLSAHSYASRVLNQRHSLNILDAVIQQGLDKTQNFVNPRMNFGDGLLSLTSGENLIPNVIPPHQQLTEVSNDGNVSTSNQLFDHNTVQAKVETLGGLDKLSPPHRMLEICANENDHSTITNTHKNRTQSEPPVRRFLHSPKNVVPCDTKAALDDDRKNITKTNLDGRSSPRTRKGSSPSKKLSAKRADSLSPGDLGLTSLKSPGRKSKGKHRKKGKSRGNGRSSPTPTGDIYIPNDLLQFNIGKGVFDALTQENEKQSSPKGKPGSIAAQGSPKPKAGSPGVQKGSPNGIPKSPKAKPGALTSKTPPSSYRVHGTSNELEHKSGTFMKPKEQTTESPNQNLACKVKGNKKCFREWQPEDSSEPKEEPRKVEKKPEKSPGNNANGSPEKASPKNEQEKPSTPVCKSPRDPVCKKSNESTASTSKPCLEQPPCKPCKPKKKRRHPCGWGDSNRGVSFTRRNFFGNIAQAVGDQLNCIAYRNSLFHSFPGMIGLYRPDIGMDSLFMNDSEEEELEEEEEEKPKSRKSKEKNESKRSEDKDDTSRQVSSDERMHSDKDHGQVKKASTQQSGRSSFPSQQSQKTSIKTAATGKLKEAENVVQNTPLAVNQRLSQKEGSGGYYVEDTSRPWRGSEAILEASPRQMSRLASPRGEVRTDEYEARSPSDPVKIVLEIPTFMRGSPRMDSTQISSVPAPPPRHMEAIGNVLDSRRLTGERTTTNPFVTPRATSQDPVRRSTHPSEYEAHRNDLPMSPRYGRYSSPQLQDRQSGKSSVHFIPSTVRDRAASYDQSLKSGSRSPNDYRSSFLKSGSQSSNEERSPSPSRLPGSADRKTTRDSMATFKRESSNLSEEIFRGTKLLDNSSIRPDSATERFSRSQTFKEDGTGLPGDTSKRSSRTIDNLTASSGRSSGSPYKTYSPSKEDEEFTNGTNLAEFPFSNRGSKSKNFQEEYRSTTRDSPSRLSSRAASSERHSSVQSSHRSGRESPRGTYVSRQMSKPGSTEKFSRQASFQKGSHQPSDEEIDTRRTSALIGDKLSLIQKLSKEHSRRGSSQQSDEEAGTRQTSGRSSSQEGECRGSSRHSSEEDRGRTHLSNRESRLERLSSNQRSSRPPSRITGSQQISDEEGNTRQGSARASRQTSIEKLSRAQSAREGSRQPSDYDMDPRQTPSRGSRQTSIEKLSRAQSSRESRRQTSDNETGTRPVSTRESLEQRMSSIDKHSIPRSLREMSQQLSDNEVGTPQRGSGGESVQERLTSFEKLSRGQSLRDASQRLSDEEIGTRLPSTPRESRQERFSSIEKLSGEGIGSEEGTRRTSGRESRLERLTSSERISRGKMSDEENEKWQPSARESFQERMTSFEKISRGPSQQNLEDGSTRRTSVIDSFQERLTPVESVRDGSRLTSTRESRHERFDSVDKYSRAQSLNDGCQQLSDEERFTPRDSIRESRQERLSSVDKLRAPSQEGSSVHISDEDGSSLRTPDRADRQERLTSRTRSSRDTAPERLDDEDYRASTLNETAVESSTKLSRFHSIMEDSQQRIPMEGARDKSSRSRSSSFIQEKYDREAATYAPSLASSKQQSTTVAESRKTTVQDSTRWSGARDFAESPDQHIIPTYPCTVDISSLPVGGQICDYDEDRTIDKPCRPEFMKTCGHQSPVTKSEIDQLRVVKEEKFHKSQSADECSKGLPHRDYQYPQCTEKLPKADKRSVSSSRPPIQHPASSRRVTMDDSCEQRYRDSKSRSEQGSDAKRFGKMRDGSHAESYDGRRETMSRTFESSLSSPSRRSTKQMKHSRDIAEEDTAIEPSLRSNKSHRVAADAGYEDESVTIASYETSTWRQTPTEVRVHEGYVEDQERAMAPSRVADNEQVSKVAESTDEDESYSEKLDTRTLDEPPSIDTDDNDKPEKAFYMRDKRRCRELTSGESGEDEPVMSARSKGRTRSSDVYNRDEDIDEVGSKRGSQRKRSKTASIVKVCFHKEKSGEHEDLEGEERCSDAVSSEEGASDDSCKEVSSKNIPSGDSCAQRQIRKIKGRITFRCSDDTNICPASRSTTVAIQNGTVQMITSPQGVKIIDCVGDCDNLSSENSECGYMNNLALSNNSRSAARSQWADNLTSDNSMKKYLRDSQYIRQRQLRLMEYEQDNTQSCDSLSDYLPTNRRKSPIPAPRMNLIKSYDYPEGHFTGQYRNFDYDEQRGRDIYRSAYRSRSNSAKSDRSPESVHVRAIDPFRQVITPEQPLPVSDKYSVRNIGEYINYISPNSPYQRQADMFLCNPSTEKVDDIGSPEDICLNMPKKLPETGRENPFLLVRSAFIPSDETDVTVIERPRVKVRPKSASAKCSYRNRSLQSPMRIEASPGDSSESQTLSANSAMYRDLRKKYRDKTSNHGHFIPENEFSSSRKSSPECTTLSVAVAKNKNCSSNAERDRNSSSGSGDFMYSDLAYHCGVIDTLRLLDTDNVSSDSAKLSSVCDHSEFPQKMSFPGFSRMESEEHLTELVRSLPSLAVGGHDDEAIELIRQNSIRALLFAASLSNSWSPLRLFSSATAKDTAKWVQELKDRTTANNLLSPQQSNATDSPTNEVNINVQKVWKTKNVSCSPETRGKNNMSLVQIKKLSSPTDSNVSPNLQSSKPTSKTASPSKGTQSQISHFKGDVKTSNKMTSPAKPEEIQEPQSRMYTPKSTQFHSSSEYQQKPRTRAVKIQVQCSKNAAIQTQSIDRDTLKCDKSENTEIEYFSRDVEVSTRTSSELHTKSDSRNRDKSDSRRGKSRRDPKPHKDLAFPKPGRRNERGQSLSHKTVAPTDLKDIFQLMTSRSQQESRGLRKKKCRSFNDTSSCACSRRARSRSEDSVYYYKESRSPSPCHRIGHRTRSHSLDRMHRPRSRGVKTKKIYEGFPCLKPKSSSGHRFRGRSLSAESVYHDRSDVSQSPQTDFKALQGELNQIPNVKDIQNDLFSKRKFLYSTGKSLPSSKTRIRKVSERNYQKICACSRCQQRRFELQRYIYLRKSFKGDKSSTKFVKGKYPLGACGDTSSQPTDKTKNNSKDFSGEERPFLDNVTIFVVTSRSSLTENEENERNAEIRYFDDVDPCCRYALKTALRSDGSSGSTENGNLQIYALDDLNAVEDNSECVTDQDTDYFSSWKSYSSQSNNATEDDCQENHYFDPGEHGVGCTCTYSAFSNDLAPSKKQKSEPVRDKKLTYSRAKPERRKTSHNKRIKSKSGQSCTSLDSGLDKSSSLDGGNKCNSSKWITKFDGSSDVEGEHNNLEFENIPEMKPEKSKRQNTNSDTLRQRIFLFENENMQLDTEHDTSILTRNKDSLLDDTRDATEFQVSSRELFSSTISQFTGSDEIQIDELLKKYIHSKTESSLVLGDNDGETISQPSLNMATPSRAEKSPSPPNRGSSSLRFLQSIIDGKVKSLLDKALQNWTSPIQRSIPLLNNEDYIKMGSPEKPSKQKSSDAINAKENEVSPGEVSLSNTCSLEKAQFVMAEPNCKNSEAPNMVIVTLPEKCAEQPKTYREMLIDWIKGALPPFEKSPEIKIPNEDSNTAAPKPKRFSSEPRSSSKSLQASAKSSVSHVNISQMENYFGPEDVLLCKGDIELPTQQEQCNSPEVKGKKSKREASEICLDPPKKKKESHRIKKEESPKLKRRRKSESQIEPIKTSRRYKNVSEHSETRYSVSKCSTTSTDNRRSHSAPRPNLSKLNLATKQRYPKARKSEIERVRMSFEAKPVEETVLVKSKSKITPFSECGVSRIANRLTPNAAKPESNSLTLSSTSTDDIKQKIQSGFKNFKHEVMERRLMEELIQRKIMSKQLEKDMAEAEADSLAECEAIESCLLTPIIEESHTPLDKSKNDFNTFVNECKSKIKDLSGNISKPNSENTLSNISSQMISSTSSSKQVHKLIDSAGNHKENFSSVPVHLSQRLDKTESKNQYVPNTPIDCSTSPSRSRSLTDRSGHDDERNYFADRGQSGFFASSLKESQSHPSLHEIDDTPPERLPQKFQEYYFTSLHYKGPFKSAFLRNELGGGIYAESKETINQLSKEDLLIGQYSTRHSFWKRNNYRDFPLDLSSEDFNFSKSNNRFSDYPDNHHNYISKTVINPNFAHPKLNFNYESRYKSTFLKASTVKYNDSYTTTRVFGHLKYSSAPTDVWADKATHWDSGSINALHSDLVKRNWNESANNGYDTSSSDNSSVDDDLNMDDGNSNVEYNSGPSGGSHPYHSGDRSLADKGMKEHKVLQSTGGYAKRHKRSCDSPCCLIHEQSCNNYEIFKPHPHSGLLSTLASRNINGSGNMFGRGGRPGDDLRVGTHLSVRSQMQDSDDDFTSASEDMMSNYTSVKMRNNFPRSDSQEMDDTCNHPDAMSYYTGGGPTSQFDVFGGAPQEDLLMNLFPMDDDHPTVISSYRQKATSERCSDGMERTGVDSKPGCSERDSYTTVSNLQPSDKGAFCASRSCFGQGDTSSKKAFTQWYVEDTEKNLPVQRRGNEVASKFSHREAWSNAIKTEEKRSEESVDDDGDDGEVDEDDEDEIEDEDEEEDYEDDENEDDEEEEENGDEDDDGDSDGSRENKQLQVVEDVPGGDARSADKDTGVINTPEANNQALTVDTKTKADSGDQRRVHGRLFNQNKYKTYGVKTIRVTSKQSGNQGQIQKYTASNLQGKTGSGYQKFSLDQIKVPAIEKERVRFACDENGDWAEIGRGSYGCVYLGLLDGIVEVAIKDFYESSSWDLVIHEARMLMFLQETGITPKFYGLRRRFDVSKQPSEYCIIMEYFGDGRTLFNVMSDKVPLTNDEWLDIVGQLVAGLRLIHRKNILINDLKADNILIDLTGGRKIIRYIDVGMATYKQGLTFQLPQDQMSKYNFLAPEVREGARTTTRSDIFSLGYMLEQMSRLADPALGGLKKLVARCTDKNPARRPDIDEIVSQVHRFIASKASVSVAQPTSQEQFLLTNSV